MVSIMGADVLATQGASASATIILIMLNRNNPVPASVRQWNDVLNVPGRYPQTLRNHCYFSISVY